MSALLGSLFGFLSAIFPEFLKMFRDHQDRKHELAILDRQIESQKLGHTQRLEEIQVVQDSLETQSLYTTYTTHIDWVDALNGTVRPIIAYAFFALYAAVKLFAYIALPTLQTVPLAIIYDTLWTQDDAAIFAGILSFYFGQRAIQKVRGYK